MASVNFMKLHSATETKAVMAHCDKEERLKHEHSNEHIDKSKTVSNKQFRNYSDTCSAYDERIAFLDSQEGANKRKDRVTCFSLEIPFPERLGASDGVKWANRAMQLIQEQYGTENVINSYLHVDEEHSYIDAESGQERMSRKHMHVFVVPEHDGRLNGKWFSNKANMNKLNNSIQKMSQDEFDCDFMDGTKRKSKADVEELKRKSEYKVLEADLRAQYDAKAQALEQEREQLLQRVLERSKALDEREVQLREREENIDELIDSKARIKARALVRRRDLAESIQPTETYQQEDEYEHG